MSAAEVYQARVRGCGMTTARIVTRLMYEVEVRDREIEYLWLALRIFEVEPETIMHALPRDHWLRRSVPLRHQAGRRTCDRR
jgi:hypothetical protein